MQRFGAKNEGFLVLILAIGEHHAVRYGRLESSLSPIAYCLLPIAYCLPPIAAYCLPLIAYRLLLPQ